MFHIEDYSYELPPGLIAQTPSPVRDASRLLVADRETKALSESRFFDLPSLLRAGDLLVVNDTRVVPARLYGRKESGGRVEILVLDHREPAREGDTVRTCLMKSSKGPKIGSLLLFDAGVTGEIRDVLEDGLVKVRFPSEKQLASLLDEKGSMPLPPYIRRDSGNGYSAVDRERYQTIFSRVSGAVAAPTAGLHFTKGLIEGLNRAGIRVAALTLHVGYGTFRPVRTADIRDHRVGRESFCIDERTAADWAETRRAGGKVVAVGTTVVRALETAARADGHVRACDGETDLLIAPGHRFRAVDALITNFHLPKSSLLFLVCAFAGRELVGQAYALAVSKRYRFYSYGDAMLIL